MPENKVRKSPPEMPNSAAQEGGINKKLLVIALISGLVAVGLFLAYDSAKEKQLTGDTVTVLKWTRDMNSGEEVSANDWVEVDVRRKEYNSKMLTKDDRQLVSPGAKVNRKVSRDEYIHFSQLTGIEREGPSANIRKGWLAVSLPVDPYYTPGGLLQVGDRADLIGLISVKGKPAKAYVLIQNLRVVAVGGRGENPDDRFGASPSKDSSARVYRSFTVEVKPEVAVQLADLMPRIDGKLWLAVRNPTDKDAQFDNRLNPEVEAVLATALPPMP